MSRPTRLLIVNPEDNITHACRALYANEGRYLLTASDIRRIVYGATGRDPDKATKGGWTVGFGRQVGHFWERVPWPEGTEGFVTGFVEHRGDAVYRLLPRGYKRILEAFETEGADFDKLAYDAESFNLSERLMKVPGPIALRNAFETVFVADPEAAGRDWANVVVRDAIRQHEALDAYLVTEPSDWVEWAEANGIDARPENKTNAEWFAEHPGQEPVDVWTEIFGQAAYDQAHSEVEAYRNSRGWVQIRRAWTNSTAQSLLATALDAGAIEYNKPIRLSEINDPIVRDSLWVIIDDKTEAHSNEAEIDVRFLKMTEGVGPRRGYIYFDFDALDVMRRKKT